MSLTSLLTHQVTVSRATASGGVKRSYQTVASNIACLIQPLDSEAASTTGMAMGQAHRAFFLLDANVREGDRLVDQDGRTFGVRGIRRQNFGLNQHLEALLDQDAETRL